MRYPEGFWIEVDEGQILTRRISPSFSTLATLVSSCSGSTCSPSPLCLGPPFIGQGDTTWSREELGGF